MSDNNDIGLGAIISDDSQVDTQTQQTQTQAVPDPIMQDLSILFGDDAGVTTSAGVNKTQQASSSQKTVFSDADPFGGKNMPKNPEALLRQLQSERDQARAEVTKVQSEMQRYKTYEDFLGSIQEDAELRRAFIADLEPDLVKPKDPLTFIQEGLKKEFPGFTPNAEEANVYGSQTWLYNQRAQDLFQDYKKTSAGTPASLKDLKVKRTAARQAAQEAANREKQEVLAKLQWNEDSWNNFTGWVGKVKTMHMAQIWDKIQKTAMGKGGRAPNVVGLSGGQAFTPSGEQTYLDSMFGK